MWACVCASNAVKCWVACAPAGDSVCTQAGESTSEHAFSSVLFLPCLQLDVLVTAALQRQKVKQQIDVGVSQAGR